MTVLKSCLLAFAFAAHVAGAESKTFSFADPKAANAVSFRVDSQLHSITGFATGLRGDLQFDPAKPETLSGSILAPVTGIALPNPRMNEALATRDWMNMEQFPVVQLEIQEAKNIRQAEAGVWNVVLVAELVCKGGRKKMEIPARLRYLKGQARERGGALSGDLLFVNADFILKRSEFGIKPAGGVQVVGDDIHISGEIAGYAP